MLSYSQIDRILRPLRNRCNALANSSRRVRPSSNPPSDAHPAPPLLLLLPPDSISLRRRLDKHQVDTLDLSRKLYAIRDSFRDFLSKILRNNGPKNTPERVASLADICATVIGSTIHGGFGETQNTEDDLASELFEAIPLQYRSKAAIAHSLDLVLHLCPHSPTLILLLLDVTLTFGLVTESHTLLRAFFTIACNPDATSGPPLCHPAHQTLLVDLCSRWTSSGLTADAFTRILLSVSRTADFATVWSCKTMKTFMVQLAKNDITSYMSCLHLISETLSDLSQKDGIPTRLCHLLRIWLTAACPSLIADERHQSLDYVPTILCHTTSLLDHAGKSEANDDVLETKNIFICLATHWLSEYSNASTFHESIRVEQMLAKHKPMPTTYHVLASQVTASGDLQRINDTVQSYTFTLRSRGLLHHEASLWACILHQVESSEVERMLSARAGVQVIKDFRLKLIDKVEDAERRCFGKQSPCSVGRNITCPPHSSRRRRRSSGEWNWDPTFGCWLASEGEPALKKPKTNCGNHFHRRLTCSAPPPNMHRYSSVRGFFSACPKMGPVPRSDVALSVYPNLGFSTLLSRAASNRTVLHPEKRFIGERQGSPVIATVDPESDDALNLFLRRSPSVS